MMYLVIECVELHDQYECDVSRTPVCLTDDYLEYDKVGYEVYKVLEDNTFELIKSYEDGEDADDYEECEWD